MPRAPGITGLSDRSNLDLAAQQRTVGVGLLHRPPSSARLPLRNTLTIDSTVSAVPRSRTRDPHRTCQPICGIAEAASELRDCIRSGLLACTSGKVFGYQRVSALSTPVIRSAGHLTNPVAMTIKCRKHGAFAFFDCHIEASKRLLLDIELPLHCSVIARKPDTAP